MIEVEGKVHTCIRMDMKTNTSDVEATLDLSPKPTIKVLQSKA